jgi:polysaccharide biosynthesis transport protein
MNNLEKYLDQVIEPKPVVYESSTEVQEPPPTNLLESVRKRWYLVPLVALAICAVGLPAIWFLMQPVYVVSGAVRIRPAVTNPLTGQAQAGEVTNYVQFVNTQAFLLMSDEQRLQNILEDLVPRNLDFFGDRPRHPVEKLIGKIVPKVGPRSPDQVLKEAIARREIFATYRRDSELLSVTMRNPNIEEARTIVNSFLRNYVGQYGRESDILESQDITNLETQRNVLQKRVLEERERIRALAEEFGTTVLDPHRDMELNRQNLLMSELARLESTRIRINADIGLYGKMEKVDAPPEQIVAARTNHINSDTMIRELAARIVQMEQDLLIAQQTQRPANPLFTQREAVLKAFKQQLGERRLILAKEFDDGLDERLAVAARQRLLQAELQKAQTDAYIEEIKRAVLAQEARTVRVGNTSLDIQDRQFRLKLDQEMLDQVTRRLHLLQMERDRRPRVQIASFAERVGQDDRRLQYAGMTVFISVVCGFGLAFLADKMDKTLQTPEDIARQIDLPILGTTTSSRTIKPALFAEQIAGDYQTIRTNLGLLYNGGMPKRLVVSSAGMREGKTTFAVNLAISLAKSGKKVLLVDGDLRKPDIGHMLNVLNNSGGLQNVLLGEDPGNIVCVLPSSGLHVLAANPRHLGDTYELLTSSTAAEQIERLSRDYDHLIVDSPPALAFPDALVWAKLSDAVILIGYAGQTTGPDLKEAKERFARVRARILGTVLSNVPVDQGLYRYSYTYRVRSTQAARKSGKPKKLLLTSPNLGDSNPTAGA